jgi:hypothetical protein
MRLDIIADCDHIDNGIKDNNANRQGTGRPWEDLV